MSNHERRREMRKLIPKITTQWDLWAFGFGWSWYDNVEVMLGVGPFLLTWTIKEEKDEDD